MDSTFTPIGREYFKSLKFEEVEVEEIEAWRIEIKNWINQRFQEVKELKSKIQEVKDWSIWWLKIWSLETQPESTTRIESRGLLTRVCPPGTRGLVYRARPIMEVDKYKDSTRWLGVEEGRL
jgi:hypothetical protein